MALTGVAEHIKPHPSWFCSVCGISCTEIPMMRWRNCGACGHAVHNDCLINIKADGLHSMDGKETGFLCSECLAWPLKE